MIKSYVVFAGAIIAFGIMQLICVKMLNRRFDLVKHLHRQRSFSFWTFGPGRRTAAICDHIRKELAEIEAEPEDIAEWVDVILLGMDGAWRAGYTPQEIADAISAKLTLNESREWLDWKTQPEGRAIEHIRSREEVLQHHNRMYGI